MLQKNQIITLKITALTNEGNGVGRCDDGMAVFVPLTAVGDVVSCRIVKVLSSYAYGRVEGILTASPDRVQEPDEQRCKVYEKCGGCCFRHITYEAELRAKQGFVRDAFIKIGKLPEDRAESVFMPIRGSECPEEYRNKLQMPVDKQQRGIVCGFFSQRSHRVIPAEKCLLQPDLFAEITKLVTEEADKLGISVYNEEKHEGVLRHIYLRQGYYSKQVCLTLVVRRKTPEFAKLARAAAERFPEITGVVLNINPRRTNVILGDEEHVLFGSEIIQDEMCGVKVEISPKSFYQVNTPAAEALYHQAAEFAEPKGKTILDLYCGAGTIGLSMAEEAEKIIGAEIVPEAVANARRNAEINGIANAEFVCADAEAAAAELEKNAVSPDVIMLDPPRKGCSEETLVSCANMRPERIVMISCNPATAARDCLRLEGLGYTVQKIRPFDLFPRTGHVETVVLMSL